MMITIIGWVVWSVAILFGLSWVLSIRIYATRGQGMNQAMPLLAGFLTVSPLAFLAVDLSRIHLLWIAPAGCALIGFASAAYPGLVRPFSVLLYRLFCIGIRDVTPVQGETHRQTESDDQGGSLKYRKGWRKLPDAYLRIVRVSLGSEEEAIRFADLCENTGIFEDTIRYWTTGRARREWSAMGIGAEQIRRPEFLLGATISALRRYAEEHCSPADSEHDLANSAREFAQKLEEGKPRRTGE
jgi:hypothetical protein